MTWRQSLTYAGWHWYTAAFVMGTFLVTKHLFGVTPSALAMIAFATITYSAVLAWVVHRIYSEDELA